MYGSWFYGQGFTSEFWGEHWGVALAGLLQDRPRYYVGPKESEEYKDFEWLNELAESTKVLRRLMVLDGLLAKLVDDDQIGENTTETGQVTFLQVIFNFWARQLLTGPPGFKGMTIEEVEKFFKKIRAGRKKPPFKMMKYREVFIKDFMNYASDSDSEAKTILRDSLSLIWNMFTEEYEWVSDKDLDARYSKFISIAPSH